MQKFDGMNADTLRKIGLQPSPSLVGMLRPGKGFHARLRRALAKAAWRLSKLALRTWWRKRHPLAPFTTTVACYVLAAAAHLLAQGWLTLLAIASIGTLPLYRWLGLPLGWRFTKRRDVKPTSQRWWYVSAYLAYTLLAVASGAWRLGPPMLGFWLAALVTFQVRWAWHIRVRKPIAVDRPERAAAPEVTARERIWKAVPTLSGTLLAGIEEFAEPRRFEADVDLTNTELLVHHVQSQASHIAKAFTVPRANVMVDYTPGRLEHLARLTVVEENPCDEPLVYDESWVPTEEDVASGVVPFHAYPNGMRGKVRIHLPGAGAVNSMFSGDTGAGKSGGMEAKAIQSIMTGLVWPMAADPQGGMSIPALCGAEGQARWQAMNDDAILDQLHGVREAMYARSAALSQFEWVDEWGDERVGLNCWDAQITGWPLVGFSVEEGHILMKNDEMAPIFKELLKMQRKVGFYMDFATQYPGIEEFGNDMAIRQCFTAGNIMAYRNTDGTTKGMILPPHLPPPNGIPSETPAGDHTKGMLVCSSQAPRSSLPTYSRTVWMKRNVYWAKIAATRIPDLDPVTAAVFAKYMPGGQRDMQRAGAIVREQIVVATPQRRETVLDRIVAFLKSRTNGEAHPGVIADAIDAPKSTVWTTLRRAAEKGQAHEPRPGVWALGPEPGGVDVQQEIDYEEAA